MSGRELQVQQLLGRKARDPDGQVVGRIEEFVVENRNGEFLLIEYHLGPAAFVERLLGGAAQLPFLRWLPHGERTVYRVSWNQLDTRDVARPRVTARRSQLQRKPLEHKPPG
jgi:hypothetical protein